MPGVHLRDARAPEALRLYAIGDVHGRLDLLAAMHRVIAAELARDRPADWRIVHLGDYVDRGPDSRGVIEFLIEAGARDPRHLFLAGNHEAGLLDFLENPQPYGLFMRFGGIQTAQSYGVDIAAAPARLAAATLAAAIPARHMAFLRGLGVSAGFGDFFFCHAGIKPGVPLGLQDRLTHRPHELSGGQQQRVAIVRALATRPDLIFADEPTGNLDSRTGREVLSVLQEASRLHGQSIAMVTHDPVAASYADRIVFLADGRVIAEREKSSAEEISAFMLGMEARA